MPTSPINASIGSWLKPDVQNVLYAAEVSVADLRTVGHAGVTTWLCGYDAALKQIAAGFGFVYTPPFVVPQDFSKEEGVP